MTITHMELGDTRETGTITQLIESLLQLQLFYMNNILESLMPASHPLLTVIPDFDE